MTESKAEQIIYSEIFHSLQGEGVYTGRNTAWVRLFNCNLECKGFMQQDPTNPETYDLPYLDFDPKTVEKLEDLPVWTKGCDSSYSWAVKFKDLNHKATATEIVQRIRTMLTTEQNPTGAFLHDKTAQETHLCFTGGEPLLPRNQRAILAILEACRNEMGGIIPGTTYRTTNMPQFITVETNGTQALRQDTVNFLRNPGAFSGEFFFSVSPKLWTVAGEPNERAFKPEVVAQYADMSKAGQLKFVLGTEDRQWDEMERFVEGFRKAGVHYPVWIMPVGALEEQQQNIAANVSDRALKAGYNVSARVHTYIYGNKIGT